MEGIIVKGWQDIFSSQIGEFVKEVAQTEPRN